MAIKRPDIYEHNNVNYAIADSDFVRGGLRTAVADMTALYALSPKVDQLKERASIVYVSGETKYYVLVDAGNVGNASGWEEFVAGGSGNGTVTGATNGLTLINGGTTAILGGALTQSTVINLNSNNLTISGGSIQYGADYSGSYGIRSLVDVGYLTGYTQSAISQNSNTVNVVNVTGTTYSATTANDFIGVSGATTIYLPQSPKACQRISIADIKGDALDSNITICSEGLLINGNISATINTDYGSITFINNGYSWSAVAFIN